MPQQYAAFRREGDLSVRGAVRDPAPGAFGPVHARQRNVAYPERGLVAAVDIQEKRRQIAAQLLRDAGFKVDLQATDWQTVVARRASQKPPKEGGWNMFFTNWVGADVVNPIANFSIGGRGKNGGWFGWAEDAKIEQLKDAYARAGSLDEQKKIATDIQKEAYDQVIYIPLGQYLAPSAWRKSLSGVLDGPSTPIFWNIDKSE